MCLEAPGDGWKQQQDPFHLTPLELQLLLLPPLQHHQPQQPAHREAGAQWDTRVREWDAGGRPLALWPGEREAGEEGVGLQANGEAVRNRAPLWRSRTHRGHAATTPALNRRHSLEPLPQANGAPSGMGRTAGGRTAWRAWGMPVRRHRGRHWEEEEGEGVEREAGQLHGEAGIADRMPTNTSPGSTDSQHSRGRRGIQQQEQQQRWQRQSPPSERLRSAQSQLSSSRVALLLTLLVSSALLLSLAAYASYMCRVSLVALQERRVEIQALITEEEECRSKRLQSTGMYRTIVDRDPNVPTLATLPEMSAVT